MATTHVHYYNHHSENKTFTQRGRVEVLFVTLGVTAYSVDHYSGRIAVQNVVKS